jgi:pimeloyl-ACP methyl ester carboxylesterase
MTPPDLVGTPVGELEARIRAWHADWPESGITGTLANFRVRDDGTIEPWLSRRRHMAIARELWEHEPVALYPRLGMPALLLIAEGATADPLRRRAVDDILAAAPGVRVEWFRPGDHDIHAQYPDRVAAAIARLSDVSA